MKDNGTAGYNEYMRIKFIKDHKGYRKGQIVEVSPNEGFGLIDSGFAQVTKDMTERDYKTSGKPTFVRPRITRRR